VCQSRNKKHTRFVLLRLIMTNELNTEHRELREEARARLDLPSPAACKAIRCAAGISRRRLADEVGVTEGAVAYWERGLRKPTGTHLLEYRSALEAMRDETLR